MKRTLVIGASENPERYAYKATKMLMEYGHEVFPYGLKSGKIGDIDIETNWPQEQNFDTITLYVGPQNQDGYKEKILNIKPKRVVFNPGTENLEFETELRNSGIEALEACTLVLLRTEQY